MPLIRKCKVCNTPNRIPPERMAETGRCGKCKSLLPPVDEPMEVDTELFDEIVSRARVPVLADFWAAWCGPCHMVAPEVARTAADLAGKAVVIKADTEQYPHLAARYGIRGLPTLMVFYNGKIVQQQAGVTGHNQLEGWLLEAARRPAA